jgi:hypothetical protein
MATISIEGGTKQLSATTYRYEYGTVNGIVRVDFTAPRKPRIGDSIVDGVFVPLTEWKINNDTSLWQCHDEYSWPEKLPA